MPDSPLGPFCEHLGRDGEGNLAAGRSRWKSHLPTVFSDHSSYIKHIVTVSQGGNLGPALAFLTTGGGEGRATVLLCVYLANYSNCLKGFHIFSKVCCLDSEKTFYFFFLFFLFAHDGISRCWFHQLQVLNIFDLKKRRRNSSPYYSLGPEVSN